jgi:catechol 2,3-dioxygenase-like lactoylglutathione lyase family enzyme
MALTINHFSVRTTDLETTRRFYADVLGLTDGPRPPFAFPGAWMYRGDHGDVANAVVHIIGIDREAPQGLDNYLGSRDEDKLKGTGSIDHIAFFADGLPSMLARLKERNVTYRQRTVPNIGLHQVFVDDPNGVVIELNYPAAEAAAIAA